MFDLRNYILKLLDGSIGKEPDYKVRENALKWYERGTLVEADLEAIDNLIEANHTKDNIVDEVVQEQILDNEEVVADTIEDTEIDTPEESEE